MVSDFLAKSYGGLSYEGIYLYVNSRVEKRNFLNQAEIQYKLYGKVKVALKNYNMEFYLQKSDCLFRNK
jgi:hypothetical protein